MMTESRSVHAYGRRTGPRTGVAGTIVLALVVAALAMMSRPPEAGAADYYWDANGGTAGTGGTGTWTTANTWRQGSATGTLGSWPNVAANNDNAFFEGTAGQVSVGATAVTMGTGTAFFNVTGYTLQTDASTTTRTVTGNVAIGSGLNLFINEAAATAARALSIAGSITGGTMTIQGAQTSGFASRLNITAANQTISSRIVINATGGGIASIASSSAGNQITGAISNSSNSVTALGATSGNSLTLASTAIISGTSSLMFAAGPSGGAGTVTLNSQSTYTGNTFFNAANSGVIRIGVANALPTTTNVSMGFSSGNGGIFDLNGFDQEIASLTNGVGGGSIRNSGGGTSTLTVSGTASPAAFTLAMTDGASSSGILALTRSGTGTLTLSAASANQNTYSGQTTLSGSGILRAGAASSFSANSTHSIGSTARLDLGGFSNSVGLLAGTGVVEGTSGTPLLTIAQTSGTASFGGTIQNTAGTLSVAKTGGATQIFTTANTYSGSTSITGGTLLANNAAGSATGSGNVTVAAATFGGNGTVSGDVTLNANAVVSPGSAAGLVGTLTTGSQVWSNTAAFTFDLTNATGAAGTGYDSITMSALNLSGVTAGGFTINIVGRDGAGAIGAVTNWDSAVARSWTLVTTTSGITGFDAADFVPTATAGNFSNANALNGGTFSVSLSGNDLLLNFTPGSYAPQNLSWTDGSSDAAWNTTSNNWTTGSSTVAFTNTDNVSFTGVAPGTVTVDAGGVSPGNITVSGSAAYTLAGGTIGGSGSLTKSGPGLLTLAPTGANAFAGGVNLTGGTIAISADGALGATAGGVSFDGGTLRTDAGITSTRALSTGLNGGTIDTNGNISTLTPTAAISVGAGGFAKAGAGNLSVTSNGFVGSGTVSVTGGSLTLGDTNSAASAPGAFLGNGTNPLAVSGGGLVIASGTTGTLNTAANTFSGDSSITLHRTSAAGTLNYTLGGSTSISGTLTAALAGNATGNSRLTLGSTTFTGSATVRITASGTTPDAANITFGAINDGGYTLTFLGNGSASQAAGQGIFMNTVATSVTGNWVIGGTNGTSGVIVSLGVAGSNAGAALTSGDVTVNPYGQLFFFAGTTGTFGSSSQTLTLSGAGQSNNGALYYAPTSPNSNTVNFRGNLTVAADGATIGVSNNSGNNKFVVLGNGLVNGTLTKVGSGEVAFAGATSGTGGLVISNGRITAESTGAIGTGDVTMAQSGNNNTRIDFRNATQTIGNLSSSWAVTTGTATQRIDLAAGTTLTINQTGTTTFSDFAGAGTGYAFITGSGSIVKAGAGMLTLASGSNTYSGGTTINAGTLVAGTAAAFGTGLIVVNGGTLDLGSFAVTNAVTMNGGALANAGGYAGATTITGTVTLGSAPNSAVTVAAGGVLRGTPVAASIGGAGLVSPGTSPGIVTAGTLDPVGGLSFALELTGSVPNYAFAGSSVNDLVRLTGTSPFAASLGSANVVDVYFGSGFATNTSYQGGFFTDATATAFPGLLDAVDSATFNYFVADPTGPITFLGTTYRTLTDWNTTNGSTLGVQLGVTTVGSAPFADGTVTNGQVASFLVVTVPEPPTLALAAVGAGLAGLLLRRRVD